MKTDSAVDMRAAARRRPGDRPGGRPAPARRAPRRLRSGAARTSSRSRSSASAWTRPRSATSASAPAPTRGGWPTRILEIVGAARQDAQPRDRLGRRGARHRHGGRRALRRTRREPGQRIVTLASLTLTPLRLDGGHAARPRRPAGRGARHRLRLRPLGLGAGARGPAARDRARALRRLRRRLAHPRAGADAGRDRVRARRGPRRQARAGRRARRAGRAARVVAVDVDDGGDRAASSELGLCDIGVDRRPARPARARSRRCARRARRRPTSPSWSSTPPAASRPRSC